MTLDKVVESFNKPSNKQVVNKLYKLLILNEGVIYAVRDGNESFYYYDFLKEENKGYYVMDNNRLLRYNSADKKIHEVNIKIPSDWKQIVSEELKLGLYQGIT